MTIVGKLLLVAVESDRAVAVPSCVGRSGQLFARIVLDTEYPRKRPLEPDLGESRSRAACIRRVGKRNVVCTRFEAARELDRISAVYLDDLAWLKGVDVFPQNANCATIVLHEVRPRCTARKCFETECTRAGKEIQYATSWNIVLKNAHPRLADAVQSRAKITAAWRLDLSTTPLARDNSHSARSRCRSDISDSRLQPAH